MSRPLAAIATFGRLTELDAKMAHGIIRYCDNVRVIIDSAHIGARLSTLLPYVRREIPIVADLQKASAYDIEELVIGASPPAGEITDCMLELISAALSQGCWVVHGMHSMLRDRAELVGLTDRLIELRHVPVAQRVAHGSTGNRTAPVLLTVASDCASGKMTTALELSDCLRQRGHPATFIATGQTGMYITGTGLPLDAIRADFVAGAAEQLVTEAPDGLVLVEGQGSLHHPAYSGVSLSLMHGAAPDLIVFCHDLKRLRLAYFGQEITSVAEQIDLVERMAAIRKPAHVIAVAAMNGGMSAMDFAEARDRLSRALGLPVLSPTEQRDELGDLITEFL